MPSVQIRIDGVDGYITIDEPVTAYGPSAVQSAIGAAVHRAIHALWPKNADQAHWRVVEELVDFENQVTR